ncbi:hypothetical protein [uncultured Prevotella sp.]|uniref:hypothetical protein n=1 Tax=uncultured Prevotella sp. TaxID=159272 RepID=UPI00261604D7|nr:hypothetical protein [uncultured Prevotella sp.]
MISERNKKTKVTNGSRFFRNAIVLLGTFSMSLMPVYSCTSESAGSVVSQQSKKPVAKKRQPQRAAVKKKVTINPKNVMMVNGKKVYFTFKKNGVYKNYLDANNNIVKTKRWDLDYTDREVLDIRCYNGSVYVIMNADLESTRVMSLDLVELIPDCDYAEKVAEGNEMEFDDVKHVVRIKTITGLAGETEAEGFTFDETTFEM